MGKRVLVIVLLALLGLFAYAGYTSYDARRAGVSGQVFADDRTSLKGDNARSSSSGSSGTTDYVTKPQETEPIVYPPAVAQDATAPAASTSPALTPRQVTQTLQAAPAEAPANDTISPHPPNGMVFTGSGRYQVYRQGNITWRLDTETGRSCVIFATDEEWKKPRVYKAGCGKT